MNVSTSAMAAIYSANYAGTISSATQASLYGALMASVTYGEAGLSATPMEAQIFDLAAGDGSGASAFDVVAAYYGATGSELGGLLTAYAQAQALST
jgi:hypothetical protein